MKQKIIISIALAMLLLSACKEEPVAEAVALSVTTETVTFPSNAAITTLIVKCDRAFTAATEDDSDRLWCTVNVLAGEMYNLSISVTANEDVHRERTARIIVSAEGADSRYITVRQASAVPRISVSENRIILNEADGLTFLLEVTANIAVSFDLPAWITPQSGNASATGAQTHTFAVTPLEEEDTYRDDIITLKAADPAFAAGSVTVAVRQSNIKCVLRVATYNVRCGGCGDDNTTGHAWSERKTLVNQLIREYDFDIFGAQEAKEDYWNQISDMLAAGVYRYVGVGCDDGQGGGFFNPVIYKTDKFDLLDHGDFWYSATPGVPSHGWEDNGLYRSCSWGKFREKLSGRIFYFFCSHLSAEVEIARNESAKLLKEKIAAIAGNSPVFAVGDYNTDAQSVCIQTILNGEIASLSDARGRSETPPTGTSGTFNSFSRSLEFMNNTLPIDFIFVGGNIAVKEYGVLNDRPDGRYPSDHDPALIKAEVN